MAELYLAMQAGLKGFEKVLAIKKILPHLTQDSEFVSMFVNEANWRPCSRTSTSCRSSIWITSTACITSRWNT